MESLPSKKLKDFADLCHRRGLTVTSQRMAVYDYLTTLCSHPTADQVYDGIRSLHPTISRASVYRILDVLAKYGIIQKLAQPGTASRYDGMAKRHPHLVCSVCGQVTDLDGENFNREEKNTDSFLDSCLGKLADGSVLEDYSVVFSGVCAGCAKNNTKGALK